MGVRYTGADTVVLHSTAQIRLVKVPTPLAVVWDMQHYASILQLISLTWKAYSVYQLKG